MTDDAAAIYDVSAEQLALVALTQPKLHVEHKDGIPWDRTPRPRRFRHRHSGHTAQWDTRIPSWSADPLAVDICRCGATTHMWFRNWSDGHRFGGWFTEKPA